MQVPGSNVNFETGLLLSEKASKLLLKG